MKGEKKMPSSIILTVIAGTCISLVGLFVLWGISFVYVLFYNIIELRTFFIILAIPVFLILIFDILIISKIIVISHSLIGIGYFVLTFGFWLIITLSCLIWKGTYQARENALYERVTHKGELIIDFYDSNDQYKGYYYLNKKVYFIEKRMAHPYKLVDVLSKLSNIDTNDYLELYEKSNKFTLLFKKEDYPHVHGIMHLNDVGFFDFFWLGDLVRTDQFNNLDIIILNEELHIHLKEIMKEITQEDDDDDN
jgi:hypothetical protein